MIMLVEDDEDLLALTREALVAHGFEVVTATDGETALELLESDPPDLIISDVAMPRMDGLTLCRKIKANIFFCRIPVILLTARAHIDDRIQGFEAGADDYLVKPVDFRELAARAKAIQRRYQVILDMNPSTRLPGANAVEEEIARRIAKKQAFEVVYGDLDHFKSYADTYGFEYANKAIKLTARILSDCLGEMKDKDGYLSHIGGDDFIYLVKPETGQRLAKKVIKAFDERIQKVFHAPDLKQGFYLGFDRDGNFRKFPIMTISLAILPDAGAKLGSAREIGEAASRLKKVAKKVPGSKFVRME